MMEDLKGVPEVLRTFQVLIFAKLQMVVEWNWYHVNAKFITFFVMLIIFSCLFM